MTYKARPSDLIVFDGQSLGLVPTLALSFPTKMMSTGVVHTVWYNRAISATTWLERAVDVTNRVDRLLRCVPTSTASVKTLFDTAGTKNINNGQTAAQIFSEASTYWTARRTAGFTKIIACTVSPSTDFTGGELTVRTDYNQLLRNAVGVELDGVADLETITQLSDPTNTTYYDSGVHYTDAATTLVAPVTRAAYVAVVPQ